ncbi:MAG: nickel pincer cofactor biosynthesis protein LarB [Gammaproteobacteria bacterium]
MTELEIRLDHGRAARLGLDEAIFCAQKSAQQIEVILDQVLTVERSCLLTHFDATRYAALSPSHRARLDFDEVSRTAYFNWQARSPGAPEVGIVTAGSSDVPVAREALRTLAYYHVAALPVFDVGVAGLWRLLERIEELRRHPVLIAVAGMDAALPSVLGGLYGGLVVAVPTSTGYGVAAGGHTALNAILASCASGLVTVNIDNGYGAACAALRALGFVARSTPAAAQALADDGAT